MTIVPRHARRSAERGQVVRMTRKRIDEVCAVLLADCDNYPSKVYRQEVEQIRDLALLGLEAQEKNNAAGQELPAAAGTLLPSERGETSAGMDRELTSAQQPAPAAPDASFRYKAILKFDGFECVVEGTYPESTPQVAEQTGVDALAASPSVSPARVEPLTVSEEAQLFAISLKHGGYIPTNTEISVLVDEVLRLHAALPAVVRELERLREIEHMAWHILDDSEEDAQSGNITIFASDDYFALCKLLPEDHPDSAMRGAK